MVATSSSTDTLTLLARRAGLEEEQRLEPGAALRCLAETHERVAGALRIESVRGFVERVARGGEAERRPLRAMSQAFLDRSAGEELEELAVRRARLSIPPAGFHAAIATAPEPSERRRLHDDWERAEASCAPGRRARVERWDDAAAAVGLASATEWLVAGHPVDPAVTRDQFERVALAPLDGAVAAVSRERRRTCPGVSSDEVDPADTPVLESLAEHAATLPRQAIVAKLHEVARVFSRRSALVMPDLRTDPAGQSWSECIATTRLPPVLLLGMLEGPRSFERALGELGFGLRCAFIERAAGATAWRYADPAFATAARWLFGRLAANPHCRQALGIALSEPALRALRLERALAPRRAWAYLCCSLERGRTPGIDELFRRALDRGPTPGDRAFAEIPDPSPAAELRGAILGLLLEEHLLTRWGRAWYAEPGARDWLLECWEAEPLETAESLAGTLGLGTIEPTPLYDRCRP